MTEQLKINFYCYKKLFVFENNFRKFIKTEMESQYGFDWILRLKPNIQTEIRNKENQLINYLTPNTLNQNKLSFLLLKHLREIISSEWDTIFFPYFKNVDTNSIYCKNKINTKFFELEIIRNFLSHFHILDDQLQIQLEANVNFFKEYIPNYDVHIYIDGQMPNESVNKSIKDAIDDIRNGNNVSITSVRIIFTHYPNYIQVIKEYNSIPKTRDKRSVVLRFLNKSHLVEELENLLGDAIV